MVEWEFKRLSPNTNKLISLTKEQLAFKHDYSNALRAALETKVPNPKFSKYYVRESMGEQGEFKMPSGNIEYGFCQALHGEESAVAAFKSVNRRHGGGVVMGLIVPKPEEGISPCGNCRDILFDEVGEELEIVAGAPNGGSAVISTLKSYLFKNYQKIPRVKALTLEEGFITKVWDTLREGERITFDGYSPKDIHPERRYYASVSTKRGLYFGGLDLMCDYHPIYPLRDAVRSARRAGDPNPEFAILLGQEPSSNPPHVMYKDRQHLFELNLQQELLSGKNLDPKVYLISQRERGSIWEVWQTSVKQWLPNPFSAQNFGDEFLEGLKEYYHEKSRGSEEPPRLYWRI